jgi:hypothetical protein
MIAATQTHEEPFDFDPYVREGILKRKASGGPKEGKYRVVVCSYWLQGLCSVGADNCTYLHKFDKSKMIACKFGAQCKIKNCPLKHIGESESGECSYYRQGFCTRGPECKLRHVKRRPDELPDVGNFDQCVGGVTAGGTVSAAVGAKLKRSNAQNENYKSTICTHWLAKGSCHFNEDCHFAHGEEQINDINQAPDAADSLNIYDPTRFDLSADPVVPWEKEARVAYFMFQAPDLMALSTSIRRGVWQISTRLAPEVNAALKQNDTVIAFMATRMYRGIYGIVKITGSIPPAEAGSYMTPEFPVQWIRHCRVAVRTVAQMKFNTGMFIGKTASDGRFKTDTGYDLLLITHRKPAWDWNQDLDKCLEGLPADGAEQQLFSRPSDVPGGNKDKLFGEDWVEHVGTATAAYTNAYTRNQQNLMQSRFAEFPERAMEMSNDYYTGENPGFIFCAQNPQIVREMIGRKLFGVPPNMSDIIVHNQTPLFLCDLTNHMLFGIFHSTSPVSKHLEPGAFASFPGGPSNLPIQLRVGVVHECPPVSLRDPELRKEVFKKGPKFGAITLEETKALANMLVRKAGLTLGGPMGASMTMSLNSQQVGPGGVPGGREGGGRGQQQTMYKPPYKWVEEVPIDIEGAELYLVKRKVLGQNASTIRELVESIGDRNTIRVRMRGIGSGYNEGPESREMQTPLHFNVSAENEQLLAVAAQKVRELVERARFELTGQRKAL